MTETRSALANAFAVYQGSHASAPPEVEAAVQRLEQAAAAHKQAKHELKALLESKLTARAAELDPELAAVTVYVEYDKAQASQLTYRDGSKLNAWHETWCAFWADEQIQALLAHMGPLWPYGWHELQLPPA